MPCMINNVYGIALQLEISYYCSDVEANLIHSTYKPKVLDSPSTDSEPSQPLLNMMFAQNMYTMQ